MEHHLDCFPENICEEHHHHEAAVHNVQTAMPDDDALFDTSEFFKALSDSSRLKIIAALLTGESVSYTHLTGGTIASRPGADGLAPEESPPELMHTIMDLRRHYEIDCRSILNLDSSNIQAEEWQLIAQNVYRALPDYDGIVITHGTDTMAYTASMLAFMLQNLEKPVVLTGSQLPISSPLSDAPTNLATAFAAVQEGVTGVSVAFDHKILNGCRAVKVRTMGFDAFESVNSPNKGEVLANGLQLYRDRRCLLYTSRCV